MRPAKTQISLGIRPVWLESSLCAQWVKVPGFLHADSEDSNQTGRMSRLIIVFAGRTCHFVGFVMRWLISCFTSRQLRSWSVVDVGLCCPHTPHSILSPADAQNKLHPVIKMISVHVCTSSECIDVLRCISVFSVRRRYSCSHNGSKWTGSSSLSLLFSPRTCC